LLILIEVQPWRQKTLMGGSSFAHPAKEPGLREIGRQVLATQGDHFSQQWDQVWVSSVEIFDWDP